MKSWRWTLLVAMGLAWVQLPAALRADDPAATQGEKKKAVDFRKLKELMPEKILDLSRKSLNGERNQMGAISVSIARASYAQADETDDSPSVKTEIMDYGAIEGFAQGMAFWSQLDIDKESDEGYERTTKIGGFPAYEKFTNDGQSGEIHVFVASRFIVNITTRRLTADKLKKAAEEMPLKALAALK